MIGLLLLIPVIVFPIKIGLLGPSPVVTNAASILSRCYDVSILGEVSPGIKELKGYDYVIQLDDVVRVYDVTSGVSTSASLPALEEYQPISAVKFFEEFVLKGWKKMCLLKTHPKTLYFMGIPLISRENDLIDILLPQVVSRSVKEIPFKVWKDGFVGVYKIIGDAASFLGSFHAISDDEIVYSLGVNPRVGEKILMVICESPPPAADNIWNLLSIVKRCEGFDFVEFSGERW